MRQSRSGANKEQVSKAKRNTRSGSVFSLDGIGRVSQTEELSVVRADAWVARECGQIEWDSSDKGDQESKRA